MSGEADKNLLVAGVDVGSSAVKVVETVTISKGSQFFCVASDDRFSTMSNSFGDSSLL